MPRDSHTLHLHGFRAPVALMDGVPEVSIAVPIQRQFTYFYRPHDPGTYMYRLSNGNIQLSFGNGCANSPHQAGHVQETGTGTASLPLRDYVALQNTLDELIVFGNEGKGVRRNVLDHCDRVVTIPMKGHVDSFNVATAAAVLCYEIVRQRTE